MTKHTEWYYFLDEETSVIWYTDDEDKHPAGMLFLGSSMNPNHRMTATIMAKNQLNDHMGHSVKKLP